VTPGSGYHNWRPRLLRFAADADRPVFERYRGWAAAAGDATVTGVLGRLGNAPNAERAHFAAAAGLPLLDRIVYVNFMTYLPDDLAVKMDRMSMAHSIEARSPFLDTAVIETAMRIPARRRIGLRQVKPVLRATFSDLLPPAIFARPKRGFGAPLAAWFRTGLSELFVDEVLAADARSRELIDTAALRTAWREHQAGLQDYGGLFWTVLTLERWLRTLEAPFALAAPAVAMAA
jgi:asparagine synthase (glutamine-hydrolysing)